jgi:hypothetical protein
MSIFQSTFTPEVRTQLGIRQKAMVNRTPQNLQYLNSRNAWIRMSSSVNVNGTNELAKKYVLQGGTLNDKALKAGLGDFNNAYSNIGLDPKKPYQRGIRPMPGIVNLDVKSKSAYGSLREVTVNFQCWDIQQLEDLELLYMRPGYTMLIEWGWTPYLDNKGEYKSTFTDYYDIINSPVTDRTELFKALFKKSKDYGGNYDAMFGYIKNYSWTARMDGGYDCQTTVISTGEIIESLKVNYVSTNVNATPKSALLLNEITFPSVTDFNQHYSKNILAGLWAETYDYITTPAIKYPLHSIFNGKNTLSISSSFGEQDNKDQLNQKGHQAYITLGLMVDIINTYVIPKDGSNKPLIELSLDESTITNSGSITPLLCISHPLQVSVDPTVCLIKSPTWSSGEIISETQKAANNTNYQTLQEEINQANNAYFYINQGNYVSSHFNIHKGDYVRGIKQITSAEVYYLLNERLVKEGKGTLEQILNENYGATTSDLNAIKELSYILQSNTRSQVVIKYESYEKIKGIAFVLKENSIKIDAPPSTVSAADIERNLSIINNSSNAIDNLKILKYIPLDYFTPNNNELATIKNIYVNVNYLYKLSLNQNLENQDKKEKSEINLYNYLKNVIRGIQTSIGSVNNFEIHVDPIDNKIARIIDINYTGEKNINTYNSLFQLQVHNLESVVRSYSMQSQMFPEQGALIAIASQAKGGQMGMQNNTMIDFNRSITDRIILTKETEGDKNLKEEEKKIQEKKIKDKAIFTLNNNLAVIIQAFKAFNNVPIATTQQGNTQQLFDNAKNALRDTIVYIQSITTSTSKNRNIIPIKFSFEMDGLGGLVIGHMFRLPDNIIPKGYRGEGVGSQLGQAITSISHTISNNDWVTKIEALNIVLNDNTSGSIAFKDLDLKAILGNNPPPSTPLPSIILTPGVNFSSKITYYYGKPLVKGHMVLVNGKMVDEATLEGGGLDAQKNKINTIEDYLEGKATYVTIAMDKQYIGRYFTNADFRDYNGKLIRFKCTDTGGAFNGMGTSKIDIATGDLSVARGNILKINGKIYPSGNNSYWKPE